MRPRSPSLWAPTASCIELVYGKARVPLVCGEMGWWNAAVELKHGDDYAFFVNGEGPFPDPRSAWQPDGPHRFSRWVKHEKFAWTDHHWQSRPLAAAVIYEAHVGTFTPRGTFDAMAAKLDHLVDLGVSHVELMPIAEFEGEYGWGYDGVSLFAPHHAYGTPDDLKRLVDACHSRGLGIILDVVYNHLGPSGNYLPRFGPYFSERPDTPWGTPLNFDGPYSDGVRRFFIDNALMWLRDYHFDGLRLDAVHAIMDTSAVHLLEQLASEVDDLKGELGRHLFLIAESDLNDPRIVRSRELGGFGIDAQWSDDIHHSLHTVLTGEREGYYSDFGSLDDLATSMTRPYVYAGRHSSYRRRSHGRPPAGLSARRFVAYLQNHDQLGNRVRGERVCHLAGTERLKIGAALILLSPYVPMLFQGEEWSASSPFQYFVDFHADPALAKSVKEGRQKEFAAFSWKSEEVPDPTDRATFARSKLLWDELGDISHREVFDWYRKLISLRHSVPAFTTGRLDHITVRTDEENQWLSISRPGAVIACNFSDRPCHVPLKDAASHEVLAASKPTAAPATDLLELPSESVVVLGIG